MRAPTRVHIRVHTTASHYDPALGFDPASGFGPALGFGPASGFGSAFIAFGLQPSVGLRPCIYCFRALTLHLLLSGLGPAFTASRNTPATSEERYGSSRFPENLSRTFSLYFDEGGVQR
ncbi:hypothetical protein CRG98_017877 [Punica granatum]|uniref:Uncharacterized protein n=1 Tax=Punica granatum TaxID=22663 RepID=A0A2I0K0X4_PUNGR|nr:hypothetical protein CRG98_017877 [Punica granatum]